MLLKPAMIFSIFLVFFDLFVVAFNFLLIVRIIMSWIIPDMQQNWFGRVLHELTEPVLAPVRRLLPKGGMVDWAPMVTIFGLYAFRMVLFGLLFHSN